MKTATLLWALWVSVGGPVHNGSLKQVYIAAYFQSLEECQRVLKLTYNQTRWAQCIQAEYAK